MSDAEGNRNNGSREVKALPKLTTDEINELIREMPLEDDLDIEYLNSLTAELKDRSDSPKVDVDAAWQNFKQISKGGGFNYSTSTTESAGTTEIQNQATTVIRVPPRRPRKVVRFVLAAAVTLVLMFSIAVAAGAFPSIRQAIARWTRDMFTFEKTEEPVTPSSLSTQAATGDSEYADLQSALTANGITEPLAPKWLPKGYELSSLEMANGDLWNRYTTAYENSDNEIIIIGVIEYIDEQPAAFGGVHEKDGDDVVEYITNGVSHYIMTNENTLKAAWTYNNYECFIIVPESVQSATLTKIIGSIYER